MKVVILAGGFGTRLAEETEIKPKPMIKIGGMPILCHIMNTYAAYDFKNFIVACGYKGEIIKEYFHNFFYYTSDFTVNLKYGTHNVTNSNSPDWQVELIDTGLHKQEGNSHTENQTQHNTDDPQCPGFQYHQFPHARRPGADGPHHRELEHPFI